MRKERIAILPGSYDPITKGHVALVVRASRLFDRVIVAVMQNSEKEYLFSEEERVALAKASVKGIPNCEVLFDSGLLIDLYRRVGASCVVKGIRNGTDYSYETAQAAWNAAHLEGFETVYLPADDGFEDISSTAVRERLRNREGVKDLLAPEAAELLETLRPIG